MSAVGWAYGAQRMWDIHKLPPAEIDEAINALMLRAAQPCSCESAGESWSQRSPPQLVLAQARDVDLIQRRDDKIGVRGCQERLVIGSGHA